MKLKKPKFWDLKRPNLISYLLLPLTIPVRINNLLLKYWSIEKTDKIKLICVDNIYLGGTGKTPTTIKMFNICKKLNLNVSTGKKFRSNQLDEEIILRNKTNLICEKTRKKILEKAIKNNFEVVIFDDGLQDRNINYDLKIVCFDSENWIGNGYLIPSGPLREKVDSLKKYDIVFLKGENLNEENIVNLIKNQNPEIKVFQTYYEAVNLNKFNVKDDYLIFSGIGNPNNFRNTLIKSNFNVVDEIIFPDHYEYKQEDIDKIKFKAKKLDAKIITTEKDYVKLSQEDANNIEFLEIDLKIKNEEDLINFINPIINEKY
jgi:tetraacyldisaccharide 4'-kinase